MALFSVPAGQIADKVALGDTHNGLILCQWLVA